MERSSKSNLSLFPQQGSSREDRGNPFSQSVAPRGQLLPECSCGLICWSLTLKWNTHRDNASVRMGARPHVHPRAHSPHVPLALGDAKLFCHFRGTDELVACEPRVRVKDKPKALFFGDQGGEKTKTKNLSYIAT